jgi:hypothetical protein
VVPRKRDEGVPRALRLRGEQYETDSTPAGDLACRQPVAPPGQTQGYMTTILSELLLFSFLAALVTGIVLAAASILI